MTIDEAIEHIRFEVERLRAELEQKKYGFCNSNITVYGTAEAVTQTADWFKELMEYRRKYAREEELAALKIENAKLNAALDAVLENHEHCADLLAVQAVRPWENPGSGAGT